MGNTKMAGKVYLSPKKNEQKLGTPTIKGRIHLDEKYTRVKDHRK